MKIRGKYVIIVYGVKKCFGGSLMSVRRVFVCKKPGFDIEAGGLKKDIRSNLSVNGLEKVDVIIRYDVEGLDDEQYEKAKKMIFSEPPMDNVYDETIDIDNRAKVFAYGYLPGQYDQRADSAAQCIQMLTEGNRPQVQVAKLIVLHGDVSDAEVEKIKK